MKRLRSGYALKMDECFAESEIFWSPSKRCVSCNQTCLHSSNQSIVTVMGVLNHRKLIEYHNTHAHTPAHKYTKLKVLWEISKERFKAWSFNLFLEVFYLNTGASLKCSPETYSKTPKATNIIRRSQTGQLCRSRILMAARESAGFMSNKSECHVTLIWNYYLCSHYL